ncbi:MAG: 2,3-bisphosphoglycerate-independent phosphoglycerate mutase [Clostridiales bacterium]
MNKKPKMLMILDGYGYSKTIAGNGIAQAKTENFDKLWQSNCHGYLGASGLDVGLPNGQIGNSEVGHLNMGAGRVVYQDLTRITRDVENGDFFKNPVLNEAMDYANSRGNAVHLMGLLSNGGVHSHIDHVIALLELAKRKGVKKVYIHCFLDGRDVLPNSALTFLDQIQNACNEKGVGEIVTIMGRYYAMDRDSRWERLEIAYDALTLGIGEKFSTYQDGIKSSYAGEITDEFVKPIIINEDGIVKDDDAIIFYNFRTDRAREIMWAFKDPNFVGWERKKCPKTFYTCFTQCDASYDVPVAFPKEALINNLGSYLAHLGKTQLRIAETEKYAHVTFFFNSQVETPYQGEDRVLIPSPKAPSYDTVPEMSAAKVTEAVIKEIKDDKYDVIILNFANPDMVGHTGNLPAVIKAVEFVDDCLQKVVGAILDVGGEVIITGDHGNAERMEDGNGGAWTAHTNNPVPYILVSDKKYQGRDDAALCDIAPTLLYLLGEEQPKEMSGKTIVKRI